MPIYDFKCPKCDHLVEDWMCSVKESKEQVCERCGEKMEVKIGAVGTVFGENFFNGMGVKRLEIIRTDEDGKEHVYNMNSSVGLN